MSKREWGGYFIPLFFLFLPFPTSNPLCHLVISSSIGPFIIGLSTCFIWLGDSRRDLLCKSYERGTRPFPCSPLSRIGISGWKWQRSELGYHLGSGYSWALGLAACEAFLCEWVEVGGMGPWGDFQRWVEGGLRLVLQPLLHGSCGLFSLLQGLLGLWEKKPSSWGSVLPTWQLKQLHLCFTQWDSLHEREEGQETRSNDAKKFFLIFKLGAH